MPPSTPLSLFFRRLQPPACLTCTSSFTSSVRNNPRLRYPQQLYQKRLAHNPAETDPTWTSILDRPPTLVRHNRKHRPLGLAFLALIPVTAFALGTWQIKRLQWKTDLIARYEDRLVRPPLPLPPKIDLVPLDEFDYRRVYSKGRFRHQDEILLGPRVLEGENGFQVITPLDRPNGSTILVNRGWIPKDKMRREDRGPGALPEGEVEVHGLLRGPSAFKKNMFTPENKPEQGQFYFPDIKQMAELTGAQPVLVEEIAVPDWVTMQTYKKEGIPIGRVAEVNLRNNHLQYIVTWYALSLATSIMFWMLVKKPSPDVARRVRTTREW